MAKVIIQTYQNDSIYIHLMYKNGNTFGRINAQPVREIKDIKRFVAENVKLLDEESITFIICFTISINKIKKLEKQNDKVEDQISSLLGNISLN